MASSADKQNKTEPAEKRRSGNSFVYIGTIIILIITVIAFVFVPALGGAGSRSNDTSFGSWKGKPISFVYGGYFANQVSQIKSDFEKQGYTDTGSPDFARLVWRRAFENTAIHLALLDYAKEAGMAVSNSWLDTQMLEHPVFLENGVFSKRKYREMSNTDKIALRKDIELNALKSRFASDSVSYMTGKDEQAFILEISKNRRSIDYVVFPFSDFPAVELKAYAIANATLFRQFSISQITIASSAKEAEQIRSKVVSGALSFEEAAKNYSKDMYSATGGSLGQKYAWELRAELGKAENVDEILALPQGEVSPVYESYAGSWVFYRLDSKVKEMDSSSPELSSTVSRYLERYERGRIEDWSVARAEIFAEAAKSGFEKAALNANLSIKTTEPFPINYGNALNIPQFGNFNLLGALDTNGKAELNGAERNERFFEAVFSLKADEVSKPLVINGNAIVIRLKESVTVEDAMLGLLEAYYPTVVEQELSMAVASKILASPQLKDNFYQAFAKLYN
ncbi:hypothetical protein MASR2M29_20700 [Spirochaetota bacterium]